MAVDWIDTKEIQQIDDHQTSLRANMSMRMVLRSSDDATLFDNKPYDFNVQLDKQTRIEGNWVVALTEINVNYTGTAKHNERHKKIKALAI